MGASCACVCALAISELANGIKGVARRGHIVFSYISPTGGQLESSWGVNSCDNANAKTIQADYKQPLNIATREDVGHDKVKL